MSTSSSGSGSSSSGAKRPAESDLAELPSAKRLAVDLAAAAGGGSSPSIHSPASSNAAPLGEHAHPLSSAAASASQDAADEEQTGGFQAGIVKTQLAHLRRQFAVVKSEAETTRARVTQLTSQRNQDALVADEVMRQWTQVQDEMTSTLMSIDPVSGLQEHAQFVAQPYSTGLAAHVAELNSQTTPTLADTAWFLRVRDTTQARAQQLRSVIAKLAVSIDQQRAVIHGLTQQRNELMSNSAALSPVAATVAQENAQQQTKLHDLQNALAALQQELFQRSNDLASQAATVDLKASLAASQHEIELLNDELRSAQRKSLKLEEEVREYREARSTNAATSSLAASTSALLAAATAATDPSTGPSTPLTAPPTLLPATSTEGGSASSSNPAEVEALQRQVAALLKTMQDHHAAFDTHRDEKSRLLKEVQALKQQLSFLPDAVIAGHPMYKQLKVQCDTAVKELMDARVLMDMLQREHFKLMQARRVELEQIELAEVARRNGYVEELRRLEDHYAKVKNEYDKLLYRQEKKTLSETTIQSSTANQEMRELIQSLQSQNTLLKSEVARNRSKADDLRVALAKLNPNDPLVQQAMAAAAEQDSASGGASTSSGSNSGANSEAVATIKQLREDLK
ncbi:hypothetical protein CAOG_07394 [Capsaspora owczarzaki ATCC 30864]|uniref:E3 ubiquitin protein ligase n=1 Tax=Capsaspora owczarzaki (strain ATCC 30864) TaxID=595528 RepID=A0A0D2URD9_CAPO3|nr:hypothetical protein CAOG_07394 [Capsaspora owczarzaki ATCC 30864]KJE97556.1 hypothetical protein CAOG_007394 [Capsaspora owczarzaki ATCC 30864]|eukprot:XP_004343253.2 hypothetical protein CAOG_07394 [Capsaspora owczarzaki ATCC 30864]